MATVTSQQLTIDQAERIYATWLEVLQRYDADDLTALYTEDCSLESPLVNHILKSESGRVEGREALHHFFTLLCAGKPPVAERHRVNFSVTGQTMSWEYPRVTPSGQQPDMAEAMDIEDGRIKSHRIYWGWYGLHLLQTNAFRENQ